MPRESYYQHLRELRDELLVLGSMVDKAIGRSVTALKERDLDLARHVVDEDTAIDLRCRQIEEKCVQLIVTQAPVAGDLRLILSIIHLLDELERMGDHAEGIAKIAIMIGDEPPLKPLIDIPRMAEKSQDMLRRSLQAFVNCDAAAAVAINAEDDIVDALYDQIYRELLTFMIEDPRTITRATRLIWVAHNLERCADRVTNICERTVYLVTGRIDAMKASKY
ncbi:MAG: phosphate signaling complex protein PhoU [Dehalococcoidia bacterium]|nr:phosphate signaling complex protein PhoU [Dehalococcoidia bacterium]